MLRSHVPTGIGSPLSPSMHAGRFLLAAPAAARGGLTPTSQSSFGINQGLPAGLLHLPPAALPPFGSRKPSTQHKRKIEHSQTGNLVLGQTKQSRSRAIARAAFASLSSADDEYGAGAPVPSQELQSEWTSRLFKRMLVFMAPALAIPLGDPLMSLVDTICIGQFVGTAELASMGPPLIVFGFVQYLFQSLQIATLTMVAEHMRDKDKASAQRLLSDALFLALACGLGLTLMLEVFGHQLVVATGVRDAALIPLGVSYLRIRALAQPAVLITMTAQAGLLAQQDAITPGLLCIAATAVSAIGNVIFVAYLGWGLQGAAITTVATQWVGALALLVALNTRGTLRPTFRLPAWADLRLLLARMIPLSVTYLSKNICYLMLHMTAAGLATVSLAAHQAVFSVWNLLAFVFTTLEQAAMAFLPAALHAWQRAGTVHLIMWQSVGMGLAVGVAMWAAPELAPQLITSDPEVWGPMRSVALQAGLSMLLISVDVAATGLNTAAGDLNYVARSYIITLVAMAGFMAGVRAYGGGLVWVWWGIVAFFAARAAQSAVRCAVKLWDGGTMAELKAA